MTDAAPDKGSTPAPTSLGFAVLAAVLVLIAAGIGGKLGESLAGAPGYWIGGYVLALAVAVGINVLFGRFQKGHLLYYLLGTAGLLAGGQFGPLLIGEGRDSGPDEFFALLAALGGAGLGFAAAALVAQLVAPKRSEP